jgi:hypothetical protein
VYFVLYVFVLYFVLYLYFLAPTTCHLRPLRRPQARWRLVSWLYTWHLAMLNV